MDIVIRKLVLFFLMFTIVYVGYYLIVIRPFNKRDDIKKKPSKKKKTKKSEERIELQYLVNKYKLDLNKINMNNLLWDIAFTNSFIISLTVIIIGLDIVKGYVWKILLGFVVLIPLILIGYKLIAIKYRQKENKK